MDDRDRLLIALLRRDARRSTVELARELNLSRSATQERLAKLRASGAIGGFTIVEGPHADEGQSAYLLISFKQGIECAQIVPALKRMAPVGMIHSLTGPVDLIVRVDSRTIAEVEAARSAICSLPGVANVSTSMVLQRHLA